MCIYFAPLGGLSVLAILTIVAGAEAPVADAFAPGFLPPDIISSGCGPFRTVLVRMLEPVFSISVGFLRVPVYVFCFTLVLLSIIGPTSCGEGERSAQRSAMPG